MPESILDTLNAQQLEAVTATEGYIRIIAGAGSGKTKALTHRYAYLVKAAGIHPGNVLCVTFTNKAAGEMKRRVRALIGDGCDTSLITTYHGFCVRVLREHIGRLFYPENFTILDVNDQKTILEEIYNELELKLDHASFEQILDKINKLKSDTGYVSLLCDPNVQFRHPDENTDTDGKIIRRYLERQKKIFGLDFNDLLNFVFVLFEKFPDICRIWQDRLQYIQVDEFQDSSARELKLINLLSEINQNLFVVGDPDQNIYEWRGAMVEILVDFDRTHPDTQTILMNQNYRSTANILQVANALIAYNRKRIKKDLFTVGVKGDDVIHYHAKSEREECRFICDTIKAHYGKGMSYHQIAVLYRSGFLSRQIEQALMNENIPYEIVGSARFFSRMEIADALSYLRLIAGDDDIAFARIVNKPRRQFGRTRLNFLKAAAQQSGLSLYRTLCETANSYELLNSRAGDFIDLIEKMRDLRDKVSVSELLSRVLLESGYEKYIREAGNMERLENLSELKRITVEQERTFGENLPLTEFLRQIALMTANDNDEQSDKVKLMTIHAAKGLEFPVCFVYGMTDGVFPSSRTIEERAADGLEEERRLCFVALTRAMKYLYLTDSENGNADANTSPTAPDTAQNAPGSGHRKIPSRFLFEMGEQNYRRIGEISKELLQKAKAPLAAPENTPKGRSIGQRVQHGIFGVGTIISIDPKRNTYNVKFDKTGAVRPISTDYDFEAWQSLLDIIQQKRSQTVTETPPAAIPAAAEKENLISAPAVPALPKESLPAVEILPIDELPEEFSESVPDESLFEEENGNDTETEGEHTQPSVPFPTPKKKPDLTGCENLWQDPTVPKDGWYCTGISDLGEPSGVCGMCGRQIIRYVHHMRHDNYPRSVGAGCVCAGKMEGNTEAARQRESEFKNRESRRRSFLSRPRKKSKNGNEYIRHNDEIITILPDKFKQGKYKIVYRGNYSPLYNTLEEALSAIFEMIDSAKA